MARIAGGGGSKRKRRVYSPTVAAYPSPRRGSPGARPAPRARPVTVSPRASAGAGFAQQRERLARQQRAVRQQRARGYGGARDVTAQRVKQARERAAAGYGFARARDIEARKARRTRRRQARGFGAARDITARRVDTERRLRNQLNYLIARSEKRGGYGREHLFGTPRTPGEYRRAIKLAEASPTAQRQIVKAADLRRAELRQQALLRGIRPYTAPAAKALEATLAPVHAVAGGTKAAIEGKGVGGIAKHAARGITLKEKTLFSDVLKAAGVKNKTLRGVAGFALDVGLDPTTYVTLGGGTLARQGVLRTAQAAQKAATRAKARELTGSIATRVRSGELKSAKEIRAARKAAAEEAREYGRRRARAVVERRRQTAETQGGVKLRIAGSQRRQAARQRRAGKISGREVRRLAAEPGAVARAPRKAPRAPERLRDLDIKTTARIARLAGATGKRKPGRFTRAAGAQALATVRPVSLSGREFRDIKAVKREARAETERMTRRAAARANALLGNLTKAEREQVIDAIEAGDLSRLKGIAAPVSRRERGQRTRLPGGGRARAARDPDRLHRVARDVQGELRYIERQAQRAGILAGRVGARSRTRTEALLGAKTRQPTKREEAAARSEMQRALAGRSEAFQKALAVRALPEDPQQARKLLTSTYKGISDPQTGAKLTNVRAGRFGEDRYSVRADIRLEGKKVGSISRFFDTSTGALLKESTKLDPAFHRRGISTRLAQAEERAVAARGVRRVETVPVTEGGQALTRRLGGFEPVGEHAPGRVAKELPEATRAERIEASEEAQRAIGRLGRAQKSVEEIPIRRAEAEAYAIERRRRRRERLRGEAKGYYPRPKAEELEGGRELAEVEGRVPETYKAGAFGGTQPPPTKQRTRRETRAEMREGTPEQRALYEDLSDDVRATLAAYGSQMARGMGKALLNREIARLGRAVPALGGAGKNARTALKEIQDGGERVYFLHRGRLMPIDTSDRRELAKLVRSTRLHRATAVGGGRGQRRAQAGLGGQYVLLRPEVVHEAQKEAKAKGVDTALGQLWDKPQAAFKTGALLTPGYLVRNLLGDLWNAHTEENVFRLGRNLVRGQKALNALGRYERGLRNFRKQVPANQRTIKLSEEQASEFARAMGRQGTPKREVDAMEVALLAERAGVIRQGRFLELMEEGRTLAKPRTPTAWQDASKRVEDSVRIATFLGAMGKGKTPREAAATASKVHFDYGDLTTFEKTVARRLMPFYTFTARNIPLQAKTLLTKPGKFANLQKAREEARRVAELPEGYEQNLNPYEARQLGLPIKIGGKTYTVSVGSPFVDLNDVISAATGGPIGATETTVRRAAELLGPWKVLPELAAGKEGYSAFYRGPIRPEEEPTTAAPAWAVKLGKAFPEFAATTGMVSDYAPPEGGGPRPGWDRKADYFFRQAQIGPINTLIELAGGGVKKGLNARDMGKAQAILTDLGIRAPETTTARRELTKVYAEIERNEDAQRKLRRRYKPGTLERISAENSTPEYDRLRAEKSELEKRKNELLRGERPEGFVAGERVKPTLGGTRRGGVTRRSNAQPVRRGTVVRRRGAISRR